MFPEWEEVLTQLQQDITDFYAANEGKTAGVDMPGFDSVSLHMWHIYVGGLRQLLDGSPCGYLLSYFRLSGSRFSLCWIVPKAE